MVLLPANSAQVLALALALSTPTGGLRVRWRLKEDGPARPLVLEWQESGAPIVPDAPRRKGYGTELIERALRYQLKAKTRLEFGSEGVFCSIQVETAANRGDCHAQRRA